MHCTNGIIIQRESGNDQPDKATAVEDANLSVKRKFFTNVDINITSYHQLRRVPFDKIPQTEQNTNIIKEYLSKKNFFGFFFDDRKHATQVMKNKIFLEFIDGVLPWSNKCFRRTCAWDWLSPSNTCFVYKIWPSSRILTQGKTKAEELGLSWYISYTWSCNIRKSFRSIKMS